MRDWIMYALRYVAGGLVFLYFISNHLYWQALLFMVVTYTIAGMLVQWGEK
jgi:hypothetical protein